MTSLLIIFLIFLASIAFANPRVEVNRGNSSAVKGKADDALTHYKKALDEHADTSVVMYNLGNVMYSQQKLDEAERSFIGSLSPDQNATEQSGTLYNLGNTYFGKQEYDKAVGAYIESLKRNPEDDDARYNLELARRMLQQQKQEQQQQQDQKSQEQKPDSNQQQQNQQQNQDQKQDQQQQQQQQEQPQQQQDQQQKQEEQEQQQQQQQQAQQMSKEEAERLLNALLSNEQDALKDVKKVKVATKRKREKDW